MRRLAWLDLLGALPCPSVLRCVAYLHSRGVDEPEGGGALPGAVRFVEVESLGDASSRVNGTRLVEGTSVR